MTQHHRFSSQTDSSTGIEWQPALLGKSLWFVQCTWRAEADVLKLCYLRSDKHKLPSGNFDFENRLLEHLMSLPSMPRLLNPKDNLYFGHHVLPLACNWLMARVQQFQADSQGVYTSSHVLGLVPKPYLTMLGKPSSHNVELHDSSLLQVQLDTRSLLRRYSVAMCLCCCRKLMQLILHACSASHTVYVCICGPLPFNNFIAVHKSF